MEPELEPRVVEDAYRVFAKYPKIVTATVASWEAEIELRRRVKTTRLRSLSCDDVAAVWWNATGDERSLKHFLPRVLECIASPQCACSVKLDDVRRRLRGCAVDTWPDDERALVARITASESRRA